MPFAPGWKSPIDRWPKNTNLTFLANPNSPSGTVLSRSEIQLFANEVAPAPLVLDEAYADFADWNGLELLRETPNLIVTRSFSKSYSLAGIRFGFAVARPEIVRELVKVKDSYNCDVLSLAAATAAIEDQDYFRTVQSEDRRDPRADAAGARGSRFRRDAEPGELRLVPPIRPAGETDLRGTETAQDSGTLHELRWLRRAANLRRHRCGDRQAAH